MTEGEPLLVYGVKGQREKEGDLTQSYDKTPYTNRKFENQRITHKRHQKLRLHNDCGPTQDGQLEKQVIQLVWLNWFTGTQPSH